MEIRYTNLLAAVVLAVSSTGALAGGEVWSYMGDTGPDNWGDLTPDWGICKNGRYQSPIDISNGIDANLGAVQADLKATPLAYGLDGPTFAVPYKAGSKLMINGTSYELKQFHFHHTSEHTLNGKSFPMEAHLVMQSEGSDHKDAVLGVFIEEGAKNAMLDQFWGKLPRSAKNSIDGVQVNVGALLPSDRSYYTYEGSMTTPGCPQGVRWFVLEQPVQASKKQIDAFSNDLTEGKTNNRPVQPLYGRHILKGS